MAMNEGSKTVDKSDDAAKDFLRMSLGTSRTRGFDVDSVYCKVVEDRITWMLFEFLKCDSVPPEESHPSRYWKNSRAANRKKFLSLWALCQALRDPNRNMHAHLFLVNYRDAGSKVRVMKVKHADEDGIKMAKDKVMTFAEWAERFKRFNDNKPGATWEALPLL
jgi:hypothetical protein